MIVVHWDQIGAQILVGLVSAVAAVLLLRFIQKPYEALISENLARLQAELASERDERTALRNRIDHQDEKRFDLLHEHRAGAMRETYSALCDLEDAFDHFAHSFMGLAGAPGPADRWQDFVNAGNNYRATFWPNRILFTEQLADKLTDLHRAYVAIGNAYIGNLLAERSKRYGLPNDDDANRRAEYDALHKTFDSQAYQNASDKMIPLPALIATAFRELYGNSAT